MQGKVEICGVNTSKLQTLSNAEMMRLIERSQQGDMDARSRLVEGNLKLVLSVVQRFLSRGENPDDLFQVGCIGLLKAIANFDTTKNVRFSTYGVPMIAGRAAAVSARLQPHPRQPVAARHGLPCSAVQTAADRRRTAASRPSTRSRRRSICRPRRSPPRSTPSPRPSRSTSRSIPRAATR